MTKKWVKAAINHWLPLLREGLDLGVDWAEADTHCWRCGCKSSLQRCHLVPKALGGPDHAANILPLCRDCHAEAPDTDSASDFLNWLKETRNKGAYETYWWVRCCTAAEIPRDEDPGLMSKVAFTWIDMLQNSAGIHATHMAFATKVALLKRAYTAGKESPENLLQSPPEWMQPAIEATINTLQGKIDQYKRLLSDNLAQPLVADLEHEKHALLSDGLS